MSLTVNPQTNSRAPYGDYNGGSQRPPANEHAQNTIQNKPQSKLLKPASFIAATTGIVLAVTRIAKKQNVKILEKKEFSDIFKAKNWNFSKLAFNTKEVFFMSASSTMGGLAAGLAFDVENEKAKVREGIQQMIGNLMIPIGLVEGVKYLFEKYDDKIPIQNKNTKNFLKIGSALGALGIGMFVGNKVANEINEHLLGSKEERRMKVSDLAGQVDDVCLATLLVAPENKFLHKAAQIIPLALIVPGYETGVKKSKYKES